MSAIEHRQPVAAESAPLDEAEVLEINVVGVRCPLSILKVKQAVAQQTAGGYVRVLTGNRSSLVDLLRLENTQLIALNTIKDPFEVVLLVSPKLVSPKKEERHVAAG